MTLRRGAASMAAVFALGLAAALPGCGGGGGGGGGGSAPEIPPGPANVVPLVVDSGPAGTSFRAIDVPFVSVTLCAPGTSTCQTLDHVAVDTGSTGLRVLSGVLSIPVANGLVPQRDATGIPLVECLRFADGSVTWGPVKVADLKLGGKRAASVPIQIVGDPNYSALPDSCAGTPQQSVSDLGANAIIGLGHFREDCGEFCALQAANGFYFICIPAGCFGVAVPQAQQVAHPVARFAEDNNGVLIQLPALPAGGAASASGSLIFGIGTQANNALGTAQVYAVDPDFGLLTVLHASGSFANSFVDSGANAYFVPAAMNNEVCPDTDPVAPGYLCPAVTRNFSLTVQGDNGTTGAVDISIADARALLGNSSVTALYNLGAPSTDPQGVVLGLPFFFGRSLFTAIEGASTPGGAGPYVAF